jgi:hypothetical protein
MLLYINILKCIIAYFCHKIKKSKTQEKLQYFYVIYKSVNHSLYFTSEVLMKYNGQTVHPTIYYI